MSNLFSSRGDAREHAKNNGGKVVDRGSHLKTDRWMVVPKNSVGGSPVKAVVDEDLSAVDTSAFFPSRKEARVFAAKVDGKIIDNALTVGGGFTHNIMDLGRQGKRWEVQYKSRDDHWDDRVLGADEAHVQVAEDIVATPVTEEAEPIVVMTLKNICVTQPDGKQLVMSRDHADFKKVAALFADGDVAGMITLMDVEQKPREWSFGNDICVIEGVLYHYGMEVERSSIAKRIIDDCESGQDPEKFVNFFRKLLKNPSYLAVKHTYDFIEHNDLTILADGNIRAWKKVSDDNTAHGRVPNYKGMILSMPRNQVEDNPDVTCSYGLHVAAKEYFKHEFTRGILLEVSVSPEDIVSVPTDYNNSKCRSCRYEVLTGNERPDNIPQRLHIDKNGKVLPTPVEE